MKLKILAVLVAAGMAASAFGQGIILRNISNAGGPSATSGGLVYMGAGSTLFDGLNFNLGVSVLGGPSAGSLTPMGTFTAASNGGGPAYTGVDMGKFSLGIDNAVWNVPGVTAGGVATIQLQMWYDGAGGLFANYGAAYAGGGFVADVTFTNPTSNPGGQPPVVAQELIGMPSIHLVIAPEPSTLALGAMGLASLLIFRRRS